VRFLTFLNVLLAVATMTPEQKARAVVVTTEAAAFHERVPEAPLARAGALEPHLVRVLRLRQRLSTTRR